MKIIPDSTTKTTANYWCSWNTQCTILPDELRTTGDTQHLTKNMRANLNQKTLFDPETGVLSTYNFGGCKGDLIALLDDGWDVPPVDGLPPRYTDDFGSLILNAEHFPDYAVPGNPAESLKRLNLKMQSLGFRGLGLWIAPQIPRKEHSEWHRTEEVRSIWEERARWCHYAGVKYWKVDWGYHNNSEEYIRMMAESCRKYAPDLLFECAFIRQPSDPLPEERAGDETFQFGLQFTTGLLSFVDTFRTYDVIHYFQNIVTVSRIADVFRVKPLERPQTLGVLNVEHLAYIAAGIGAAQGMMYHECFRNIPEGRADGGYKCAIDAAFRVFRWNRIAAPFSVFDSENHISDEIFTDGAVLDMQRWPFYKGYKAQKSPAALSRNCPLPVAESVRADGIRPFVLATKYPEGAFAIATLPRTIDENQINVPVPANVKAYGAVSDRPVGIFGTFASLDIEFDSDITGKRVFAQDLLADSADDCTDHVKISGHHLILDGAWIQRTGLACSSPGDTSEPGIVLQLI